MSGPINGPGKHIPVSSNNFESSLTEESGVAESGSGPLHALEVFLQQMLGGEKGIRRAIGLLRDDRFSNEKNLTKFLKEVVGEFPEINEKTINEDPLFAMLVLMLKNDPSRDHWREFAGTTYIAKHPEDERFEKAYVYLKEPHILLAHLLISTDQWMCANPENKEFYDEQMAGLFHGTVAFDKGDKISPEELDKIQQMEGENPRYPIADKLVEKKGYYEVTAWCSTPAMCKTESRLDDLFVANRRDAQECIIVNYIDRLKETSPIVQASYKIPSNQLAVVALIGPYGSGKSEFIHQKFPEEKITTFSLDKLNDFLRDSHSRSQDHHFEAMMLTSKLLRELDNVPVLLTETAAIDKYCFNRLVNRDFSSRDKIIIEEIAPEKTEDAVNRFLQREGMTKLSNQSRIGAAKTSAEDALKYREGRIEMAKDNPKISYTLYCSSSSTGGNADFLEIAKAHSGKFLVNEGQNELFKKLLLH